MIDLAAYRAAVGCWHGRSAKPTKTRVKNGSWARAVEKINAEQLAGAGAYDFIRIMLIIFIPIILMFVSMEMENGNDVFAAGGEVETKHYSMAVNISTKEETVRSCSPLTLQNLLLMEGVEPNPGPAFICHICGEKMKYARNLQRHITNRHETNHSVSCNFCKRTYKTYKEWEEHMVAEHRPRTTRWQITSQAFKKRAITLTYMYHPTTLDVALGEDMENAVIQQIKFYKGLHGQIRFFLSFVCLMKKESPDDTIREHFFFQSKTESLLNGIRGITNRIRASFMDLRKNVLDLEVDGQAGSGWSFESAEAFNVNIVKLSTLKMGRYIKFSPRNEKGNKIKTHINSTTNVENRNNNKCLLYNIAISLFSDEIVGSKSNPANIEPFLERIEHSNIDFDGGVEEADLENIERKNLTTHNIAINVWRYLSPSHIEPFFISKNLRKGRRECDMLLIEEEDNQHLIHIKSKSDLFRASLSTCQHRPMKYFCPSCNLFRSDSYMKLSKHFKQCRQPKYFNKKYVPSTNQFLPDGNMIAPPSSYRSLPPALRGFFDFETLHSTPDTANCIRCSSTLKKIGATIDVQLVCTHTNEKKSFSCSELPAIAFSLLIVDPHNNIVFDHYYCGEDAAKEFIKILLEKEKHFYNMLTTNIKMVWREEDQEIFDKTNECCECGKVFSAPDSSGSVNTNFVKKVRDHDHQTGGFRAALCNGCNLQKKEKLFIPLYCHNFRGFDSHLIIRAMDLGLKKNKFSTMSRNEEQIITMSIGIYKMIDSASFMPSSLSTLTELLKEKNPDKFKMTKQLLDSEKQNIAGSQLTTNLDLLSKGVYPFEYITTLDRLKERNLPAKEHFSSSLKGTEISDADYQRALYVFAQFGCSTIGDYMRLYCKTDVYLLADIWSNFCEETFNTFQIHPESNYLTLPSFAFDCFKKTIFKDQVLMQVLDENQKKTIDDIDNGIRGGSVMLNRKVSIDTCLEKALIKQANADERQEYAKIQEELKQKASVHSFELMTKKAPDIGRCQTGDCFELVEGKNRNCALHTERCIIALDENNLYGSVMTKALPLKDFKDLSKEELEKHQIRYDTILKHPSRIEYDKNSLEGYIFVVDLEFSKKAQRKLLSYPLIPQQLVIEGEMLSEHQKKTWKTLFASTPYNSAMKKKMVNSFHKKKEYTCHYQNLAFYCKLGVKAKLVRGYKFHQSKFISPYVKLCAKNRKAAKSASDKKLWKDMANIIFGKLIEDVKKRSDVRYYNTFEGMDVCLKNHVESHPKIINENLVQVSVKKREVKLDKPTHVGFAVLELR